MNYKLTINDKVTGVRTESYILYLSNLRSIQLATKSIIPNSIDEPGKVTDVSIIKGMKEKFIFKDFANKKLILSENIFKKQYLIDDTLNCIKWKFTAENRIINELKCKKALTSFRGRNYIVWYTEEIPVRDGPWKFCGLPGLIVNVYDDKSIFNYELTDVNLKARFNDNLLAVPKSYTNNHSINHKAFMLILKKKLLDYQKLSRIDQSTKNATISDFTIALPEKQEKF